MVRFSFDKFREAMQPVVDREREYEASRPGITDQPCACCGLTWYCDLGQDGKVYCDICMQRGHGEEGL